MCLLAGGVTAATAVDLAPDGTVIAVGDDRGRVSPAATGRARGAAAAAASAEPARGAFGQPAPTPTSADAVQNRAQRRAAARRK